MGNLLQTRGLKTTTIIVEILVIPDCLADSRKDQLPCKRSHHP